MLWAYHFKERIVLDKYEGQERPCKKRWLGSAVKLVGQIYLACGTKKHIKITTVRSHLACGGAHAVMQVTCHHAGGTCPGRHCCEEASATSHVQNVHLPFCCLQPLHSPPYCLLVSLHMEMWKVVIFL